ncbi:MAG: hypothetical protein QOH12_320 [Solirubrobacteraceae bacterium]|jgi:hypothetical protein|nr:hypothetical protein [Solirubrobacteraceae bacterium]
MNRTGGRGLGVTAGVIACLCISGSPAAAEVGAPGATVQALAADAQFLEYAPPPAAPGVVCLIDSGVDPNPDTTPILAGSYALQPGTDTTDELSKLNPRIQPGNHPDGHGTYMAMIMAAPVNGWGMAGIAPTSVKVYSLKALPAGQRTFSYAVYANSIVHCEDGPIGVSGIKVVNLSLASGTQPNQAELANMQDAVAYAHQGDISVVGAAGNDSGPVSYPAAASGVLAVGATDASPASLGVFCPSSDRGPPLGILAPGCAGGGDAGGGGGGIEVSFSDDGAAAWASGTSESSAIVSAVLASIRAYDPNLTAAAAEGCLISTAVSGGNLDAGAAFRACGLGAIVTKGMAAYRAATALVAQPISQTPSAPPVGSPGVDVSTKPAARLSNGMPQPRVLRVQLHGQDLIVTLATVPRGARVRIAVERIALHHFLWVTTKTVGSRIAHIKVRDWDRISVTFLRAGAQSGAVYVTKSGK